MFDYSKYENATSRQIFHTLTLAEKRVGKLTLQIKANKKLSKFLQKS